MTTNQNNVFESSTLGTLSGLNVVLEDESEYVFVDGDVIDGTDILDDDDIEWDDESYDRCDLSPELSCATSVATNITLKDLNLIEDSAGMMDVDDEVREGGSSKEMSEDDTAAVRKVFASAANPKNGRRISNKKLRKKMKMMKKAAAKKAAVETATEAAAPRPGSPKRTKSASNNASSPKRNKSSGTIVNTNNVAVACARESLTAYREEIEEGEKERKTRAVSIDL